MGVPVYMVTGENIPQNRNKEGILPLDIEKYSLEEPYRNI